MPGDNASNLISDRELQLAPYAARSCDSAGREHAEPVHPYRGVYQRDRDRLLHSAAFRRLSGKTQVFTGDMGDYHRNRLTHTLEVVSVARTLGRYLRLNEDLIEALALIHDIGHPPFGHAGEQALNASLCDEGGFSHNAFALTLVRELERPYPHYPGLNLTREVLACQQARVDKESARFQPLLEAQAVDAADSLAYNAHDLDDATKLGLIDLDAALDVPLVNACHQRVIDRFGSLEGKMLRRSLVRELIDFQVEDVLRSSETTLQQANLQAPEQALHVSQCIAASRNVAAQKDELQTFLFDQVYRHPRLARVRAESQTQLQQILEYYNHHPDRLPHAFRQRVPVVGRRRAAADYLAGMTDRYCLELYRNLKLCQDP